MPLGDMDGKTTHNCFENFHVNGFNFAVRQVILLCQTTILGWISTQMESRLAPSNEKLYA